MLFGAGGVIDPQQVHTSMIAKKELRRMCSVAFNPDTYYTSRRCLASAFHPLFSLQLWYIESKRTLIYTVTTSLTVFYVSLWNVYRLL